MPPPLFRTLAALGVAWNVFGLFQFSRTSFKSAEALRAGGMNAEQATLYAGLPLWMTLAFALGVAGGTLGSLLLLLRHRLARPVLLASLLGYVALYLGDLALGVFAAFGLGQVLILSFVLLVAAGLLLMTARAPRATLAA